MDAHAAEVSTKEYARSIAADVANIIKQQIPMGVLWSLGVDPQMFHTVIEGKPGLILRARILPFNADGKRSVRPMKMSVVVLLEPSDTYQIIAYYNRGGKVVNHARTSGVYADTLQHALLALDYDGKTPFNPRLWN